MRYPFHTANDLFSLSGCQVSARVVFELTLQLQHPASLQCHTQLRLTERFYDIRHSIQSHGT